MAYVGSYVGLYLGSYLGSAGLSSPIAPPSDPAIVVYPDVPVGQVDHLRTAIGRLPEQFKNKTNVVRLLYAMTYPAYDLETALWQLFTLRFIDTAIGVQLDAIGDIVGQDRGGLSDDDYRRYLRARIAANRSHGTTEDLIKVANLVINDDASAVQVQGYYGTVVVRLIDVATSDALAAIVIAFMRDAVASGIRVILESVPIDESAGPTYAFACARGSFIQSCTAGDALISAFSNTPVNYGNPDMLDYPPSGSLIIDQGLATAETVAYASRDASAFYLSGTLAFSHAATSYAGLVEAGSRGLGDSTEGGQPSVVPYATAGTTGGAMVDARE